MIIIMTKYHNNVGMKRLFHFIISLVSEVIAETQSRLKLEGMNSSRSHGAMLACFWFLSYVLLFILTYYPGEPPEWWNHFPTGHYYRGILSMYILSSQMCLCLCQIGKKYNTFGDCVSLFIIFFLFLY